MKNGSEPTADPTPLSQEGGVFAALGEMRSAGLSAERLARGADSLSKHMADSSAATATTATTTSALSKLALLAVGVITIAGVWWALRTTPTNSSEQNAAKPVAVLDAGSLPLDASAAPLELGAIAADARTSETALPPVDAAVTHRTREQPPKRRDSPRDAAPPQSQLPEQLLLLKEAKALARAKKYDRALGRLAELKTRFPNTPLRAEADLRRAIVLSASGRVAQAESAVRALLKDSRHAGRTAELHHMLVDLLIEQGRCGAAQASLGAAIAAGLGSSRRQAAETGVARCKALDETSDQETGDQETGDQK